VLSFIIYQLLFSAFLVIIRLDVQLVVAMDKTSRFPKLIAEHLFWKITIILMNNSLNTPEVRYKMQKLDLNPLYSCTGILCH
jgi:hypothetical protein